MPELTTIDNLIRRCANREPLAWSKFIDHFSRLIFFAIKTKINKLCLNLSETDVYDIYQQVFLSIWQKQKLKSIKNPKSITRWLIIVTQNETVDYIKSRQHSEETETIDEISTASAYTPLDETHKNELEKEIEVFMDTLLLKERRIATLDILYDLKYTQISKIVNLPIGTIASVIKRVRVDLKTYLLKKGYKV